MDGLLRSGRIFLSFTGEGLAVWSEGFARPYMANYGMYGEKCPDGCLLLHFELACSIRPGEGRVRLLVEFAFFLKEISRILKDIEFFLPSIKSGCGAFQIFLLEFLQTPFPSP
jgi:hypothetical protein